MGGPNKLAGLNSSGDAGEYKEVTGSGGITISHVTGGIDIGLSGGVGSHNMLSTPHADSVVSAAVRGSLIAANSTPAWARFPIGAAFTALVCNGTDPAWGSVSLTSGVAGILPVANLPPFAVGASGSDFAVSAGATITYSLPDAGASARGVVSTGSQTIAGTKTFSSPIVATRIGPSSSTLFTLPTADGISGQAIVTNGSAVLSFATVASAGGVNALNGLTGTLSLVAAASGSDFAISPSGSTITLALPDAGAAARGLVSTGSQTVAGAKTFSTQIIASAGVRTAAQDAVVVAPFNTGVGQTGEVRFLEIAGNGTNYVGFKAASTISADLIWTLPASDGNNTQVLTTNGAGILSWSTASGGSGSTLGVIHLYPGGYGTDNSGTGNTSSIVVYETSTGTQTTNTPKVSQQVLEFSASVDNHWLFAVQIPHNYSSGGTLRGTVRLLSTTGNVVMKAGQVCSTNDTTDDTATVFVAADNSSPIGTDSTLQLQTFTIALTTTGMAADRKCVIFIGRDPDHGSDDNASACRLASLDLEFVVA